MLTGPELAEKIRAVRGRWPACSDAFMCEGRACAVAAVGLAELGLEPCRASVQPLINWRKANLDVDLEATVGSAFGCWPTCENDWDAAILAAQKWRPRTEA